MPPLVVLIENALTKLCRGLHKPPLRLGVLISGRGSNLDALLRAIDLGHLNAEIVVVGTDRPGAAGLEFARSRGIPVVELAPKYFPTKANYEAALRDAIQAVGIDWLVLAGYMRLVGDGILKAFPSRILNIHPSLLPSFRGLDAQKQAFEFGVKVTGCTVHIVTEQLDDGPILAQKAVPVLVGDTVETLTARILEAEHIAYAEAIQALPRSF